MKEVSYAEEDFQVFGLVQELGLGVYEGDVGRAVAEAVGEQVQKGFVEVGGLWLGLLDAGAAGCCLFQQLLL